MTDTATPTLPIPQPPRPLGARGRRRSWNERPVRVWMILTIIVAIATAWFAIRDVSEALKERRLIRDGTLVKAKVESVDGYSQVDRSFSRDVLHSVKLSYALPGNERNYETELDLPQKLGVPITPGDRIDLRVDPTDPTYVTMQTRPRDWMANLAVVTLFVAGLTVVLLITLWQQRRIRKTWRFGEHIEGIVVDTQQAGIAPASRVIRFTLADAPDDDQRLFSTLWPNSAGPLETGDTIDLIISPGKPGSAIAAKQYL